MSLININTRKIKESKKLEFEALEGLGQAVDHLCREEVATRCAKEGIDMESDDLSEEQEQRGCEIVLDYLNSIAQIVVRREETVIDIDNPIKWYAIVQYYDKD